MDATELIEEAGRVAAQAAKQSALDLYYSPCTCSAPPRGHTTRQHDYRRLQVDELRAVLDVVERLAAALKASEERARKAEQDRDTIAAANLAANKRIVELEHERYAARAELARLTTPRPIAEAPLGTWIVGHFADVVDLDCRWRVVRSFGHDRWRNHRGDILTHAPTHFLPLLVLP